MMILACIDGGLFCIPAMVLVFLFPTVGTWLLHKWYKLCKKSCKCDCHDKKGNL